VCVCVLCVSDYACVCARAWCVWCVCVVCVCGVCVCGVCVWCVSDYVCSRNLNTEAAQDRLELFRHR